MKANYSSLLGPVESAVRVLDVSVERHVRRRRSARPCAPPRSRWRPRRRGNGGAPSGDAVHAIEAPSPGRVRRSLPTVGTEETHDLRYDRVDGDPNLAVLVATMDATAEWAAIRRLRAWERDRLGLERGQRLLDVGCGPGHAALALAEDLGDDGELVGIDASAEMIAVARARAGVARCHVRFSVGDALALDEPDDVLRCGAIRADAAMAARSPGRRRRVRPGGAPGRIGLAHRHRLVDAHHRRRRRRHRGTGPRRDADRAAIDRPLSGAACPTSSRAAGLEVRAVTQATHTWDGWDPDESPAPHGCFSITSLADDLVDAGQLQPAERGRFVATIRRAARDGRFSMALTMFAVVAERAVLTFTRDRSCRGSYTRHDEAERSGVRRGCTTRLLDDGARATDAPHRSCSFAARRRGPR